MALEKLKKLERTLGKFKARYVELEAQRDALKREKEELESSNRLLRQDKEKIKKKVDSLIGILEEMGL